MSDQPSASPPKRRRPFVLTFFGVLTILSLIAMPFVAGKPGGLQEDWVRFAGHFHPLILHVPIGVFVLVAVREFGVMLFRRRGEIAPYSTFSLFFGAATAVMAVLAGFLLYHGHPDDYASNSLAQRHLWVGLAFGVLAVVVFLVQAWTVALCASPKWYRILLFASVGVMGVAGHDGASITHGSDYLTQYAPDSLRKWLGMAPGETKAGRGAGENPVIFSGVVAPILERRCVSCHQEGKSKGKLRMDTYEFLVKGGRSGPAVLPGNPVGSLLIKRIDLPETDDEHMPPAGKPDLTKDEVTVLKWWIEQGADPAKRLKDVAVSPEVGAALASLPSAGTDAGTGAKQSAAVSPHADPSANVPADSLKSAVAELSKEFPGVLSFESQQSAGVAFTAVSLRGKLDDAVFAKFSPVLPSLVTADLSATRVTDAAVSGMAACKNLRQIRLAETSISDAALDTLAKLPSLESINLYGTKVTDAGVAKLAALKGLKHIYLWQTQVSPEAVKQLKEKLPECEILTGS